MYKKIIVIMVIILLVGCTENEQIDLLKTDIDDTKQKIELVQQANEALNSRIDQLISDVEAKNSTIQKMQQTIDDLN